MPVISVDLNDLMSLIGNEIKKEVLEKNLLGLGAELKEINDKNEASIDVLANRPDMYCIEGIARAVMPFIDEEYAQFINYKLVDSDVILKVEKNVENVRPYIVGAIVKNVKMNDHLIKSIMDIQEKLHLTIGRKRDKVSIGIHDSLKIVPPFTYKAVNPDTTKFIPLGMGSELSMREVLEKHEKGIEYGHILEGKQIYPIITDSINQVLSFPPIINGILTMVTPRTENLFIDITGTNTHALNIALNVVCTSLADRGASIERITIKPESGTDFKTPDFTSKVKSIDPKYVQSILGEKITTDEIISSLKRLRYDPSSVDGKINVKIPCYRSDILHDIDIVEDIALGHGYWKIAPSLPRAHTFGRFMETEKFCEKIELFMEGHGFNQTYTSVLSSTDEQFAKMNLPPSECVTISNPISTEQNCVRVSILPSLLRVLVDNKHRELPQKIFEIGEVVLKNMNKKKLGIAVIHSKAGFTECKSIVESVVRFVHDKYTIIPKNCPSFIDGRCASVMLNDKEICYFGEINPLVLENFNLTFPVVMAQIDIEDLKNK